MENKTMLDFKEKCICGDYLPYRFDGIICNAPLQPVESCMNCWHKTVYKDHPNLKKYYEGYKERLDDYWNRLENMSDTERTEFLLGVWDGK